MNNMTERRILEYRKRYSKVLQIVIDLTISNLSSTRKCGKISESILLREYEYWAKFSIIKVIGSMIVYNSKKCYLKGCSEKYLRGIIRNINEDEINKLQLFGQEQLESIFKRLKENTIGLCNICNHEGYTFDIGEELKPRVCKCLKEFEKSKLEILKENSLWIETLGDSI